MKFLIDRDKNELFKIGFISNESEFKSMNSIVLVYKEKTHTKSTAILKSILLLGGLYKTVGLFFLIPKFIRDGFYTFIAKNRYKWFGKLDTCPTLPAHWLKRLVKQAG
jgi:predicted DCC family thiol-disulfide oxidoreductase YuxK